MVRSIKFWLLMSFTLITCIFLFTTLALNHLYKQIETLESSVSKLRLVKSNLLESYKVKEDLFFYKYSSKEFFDVHVFSEPERAFGVKTNQALNQLNELTKGEFKNVFSEQKTVYQLIYAVKQYKKLFVTIMRLQKIKGFKNYGLEGKMRVHAHALLDLPDKDIRYHALVLRRHEKDFIMRRQKEYIHKFNAEIRELISLVNKKRGGVESNSLILYHVYYYSKYFNAIAKIERRLGFNGKSGLLNTEKNLFEKIISKLTDAEEKTLQKSLEKKNRYKKISTVMLVAFLLLLLFTVLFFTNLITNSVNLVTGVFSDYVNSGFNYDFISHKPSKIAELNSIYKGFVEMANKIYAFTNHFREMVDEKTAEVVKQKEEIIIQQRKIEEQYSALLKLYSEIQQRETELKLKNDEIFQSLRYSKNIQKALTPRANELKKPFSDSFIFFKAKDVISGDFHLFFSLDNGIRKEILILGADCTGHGVPGALISVLGINSIQKIINLLKTTEPGKLLQLLDRDFSQTLNPEPKKKEVYDGMDIVALRYLPEEYKLEYCCAKYNLFIVREKQALFTEHHRYSIGYHNTNDFNKEFKTNVVQLQKGDCVYLFSDGFSDQFGGPENKKFKKKKLQELLIQFSHFPMKEQKDILRQNFVKWKGRNKQTDDITVIGFRV